MLETDANSRRHLLLIAAFFVLIFGGFAVYGTVQRSQQGGHSTGFGIGDPAPVSEDRAAFLAERRVWFSARQAMAKHGKDQEWGKAILVADNYLRTKKDTTIRKLRAEAFLRMDNPYGEEELAQVLANDNTIPGGERALLRGDTSAYQRETKALITSIDESKVSVLDANNSAWQAAVGASDADTTAKAIRLSEYAVAGTRKSETPSPELATYTNTQGGLYVRAKRYSDALRVLSESERLHHDMFNAPFFALAYQGMGDHAKAQAWRDRLRKHLTDTYATRDSQENRHELLLLWRETEQTVKETPSHTTNETNYGI